MGLSEPYRVGQASEVRIELLDSAPMQIDGEPWEQHPADITITHHKQVILYLQTSITDPYLFNSVGDLDLDPRDPHVFGPPGSESIRYGTATNPAPDSDPSLFLYRG